MYQWLEWFYLCSGDYGYRPNLSVNEILHTQRFINLFMNRFNYNGLPDSFKKIAGFNKVNELMLFFSMGIAWFEDPVFGLQALPVMGQWQYNMAGIPTVWTVFGMNGYHRELNENNSVLMFNDRALSIPFLQVYYNLKFMLENDKTHAQNLKAQRQPYIMELEEDESESAHDFMKQLTDFEDVIKIRFRKKKSDKKGFINDNPYETRVFESGKDFDGGKFADDYRYFENRILTYLGINNENYEKKERMIRDEVNANNQLIQYNFNVALETRQEALEKVNKMFGTNITIERNPLNYERAIEVLESIKS